MNESYFVGVDVGSGSVRAALFKENGNLCKDHVEKIDIYNPEENHYEQSSSQIWEQVCRCVKKVCENVSDKSAIKGLGFDATCSLVVLDGNYQPISISLKQEKNELTKRDIVMWMDHRADVETDFINSKNFSILKFVGGKVFIEMEMPKILWIKNNLKDVWENAAHFFDLADFLTFKATGKNTRSLCSLVCKWNYSLDEKQGSWDDNYLQDIGLGSLILENHKKIGNIALQPGELCGYVNPATASSMGLHSSTAVGISLLDAHAGGLGLLASRIPTPHYFPGFSGKLALICGTSTCHMCVSKDPTFVKGVFGPFYNAMIPELWLNEAGQSATGSLVDHILKTCPIEDYTVNCDSYAYLDNKLFELTTQRGVLNMSFLTKDLHVYPDFHGNRSPLADPSYKGMMCGLNLDCSIDTLALKYLATLQALTYGTKDIIEKMESCGSKIKMILMCGGLAKSDVFVQLHADVLQIPVFIPNMRESVLLGSAMLGACASGHFGETATLIDIAAQMGSNVNVVMPSSTTKKFHEKKFKVFKLMQDNWKSCQNLMV